jgi:hypothetical protein
MSENWIVAISGAVVIVIALCATYTVMQMREQRLFRNAVKMKAYEEFFHAITEINVAYGDESGLKRGKIHLARTLNRLNMVASREVLTHVNELLEYLNEVQDNDFDQLKELNILNTLVRAVRKDLDPRSARVFEEPQFRFRFYSPPLK